jgi:hypothetical protein
VLRFYVEGRDVGGGDSERTTQLHVCYMSDDEQIEIQAGLTCVVYGAGGLSADFNR